LGLVAGEVGDARGVVEDGVGDVEEFAVVVAGVAA
jgi:hypothetical protein